MSGVFDDFAHLALPTAARVMVTPAREPAASDSQRGMVALRALVAAKLASREHNVVTLPTEEQREIVARPARRRNHQARAARTVAPLADGRHLRAARTAAGLSRAELARVTGYSEPAVKVWERQVGRAPSNVPATIERIVDALRRHGVEVSNDPPTIRIVRNGY